MKTTVWWADPQQGLQSVRRIQRQKVKGWHKVLVYVPVKKARSRAKGSELELRVAKVLNRMLYGDQKVLRRTPLSGGWSKDMGDVCADPEMLRRGNLRRPNLYVECKNRRCITAANFLQWITGDRYAPAFYADWYNKAHNEAGGRPLFLVFKGDDLPPTVVLDSSAPVVSAKFGVKILDFKVGTLQSLSEAMPFDNLFEPQETGHGGGH